MLTYYPFRPILEGAFLARFHQVVRELLEQPGDIRSHIETVAIREYEWATSGTVVNPSQRRIYRAIWLLLRDLMRVRWGIRMNDGTLEIAPPPPEAKVTNREEAQNVKAMIRNVMSESRLDKIAEGRDWIERMEAPAPGSLARVPITCLIADGKTLSKDMKNIAELANPETQLEALRKTIKPYLQLVRENERCEFTGHKLADIWRYFRYTWATPAENTPGRTMLYLVRDAARPYHPVMGLASLENAPIKIAARDDALGWSVEAFRREVEALNDEVRVREAFQRLLKYIITAQMEISVEGLCEPEECENPSEELIQRLAGIAAKSASQREAALLAWQLREEAATALDEGFERSTLGNIPRAAEEALYRRKRADQLGRLLVAKKAIKKLLNAQDFTLACQSFLNSEKGEAAIRTALYALKSRHIGTSILELNVCGAIPPYNELLAGKLVALLMLSSQVVTDYRERYGNRPSDIASRLKGEDVIRRADLVYIGTTSLYSIGSSQYNRLRLPSGLFSPSSPEIRWNKLGTTSGFGTWHISQLTLRCLEEAVNQDGYQEVNHVFGEGSSPKLRIIRQSLDTLFEAGSHRAIDEIAKHAMGRIVYGAWLATNSTDYLRETATTAEYPWPSASQPSDISETIVDYWRARWLRMRLAHGEALERIASFDPESIRISRYLPATGEVAYQEIRREGMATPISSGGADLHKYLRELYRGTSSFADNMEKRHLAYIHIPTRLDTAVLQALRDGKSVVLTGNPGDGKTHLLRILEDDLREVADIELDASKVSDEELYERWAAASKAGRPFCVAINESVLFSLAKRYPNFNQLQEAWRQVENAILYEEQPAPSESVVVFDLSRRNILSPDLVSNVIDKLCDEQSINPCQACIASECDFVRNWELLRTKQVRQRLQALLDRLAIRGYHATLREIEAFVSYLLFSGRDCPELIQQSGGWNYLLPQLVFTGKGRLFDALRQTFDPAQVSHPIWDDRLVRAQTHRDDWLSIWPREDDALEPGNWARFEARKRAFFFCHAKGDELLKIADDDETLFARFLELAPRDAARQLIKAINECFGAHNDNDKLRVWYSHRYNQSPRRILYSTVTYPRSRFEVVHPRLQESMKAGLDMAKDHVILRLKEPGHARLRVDFPVYELLLKANRGVPVLSIENDATRRIWQFMEHLSQSIDTDEEQVLVLDPTTGMEARVTVDVVAKTFLDLHVEEARR